MFQGYWERVSFFCTFPLIIQRENDDVGKKRKDGPRKKLLASQIYGSIPHLSTERKCYVIRRNGRSPTQPDRQIFHRNLTIRIESYHFSRDTILILFRHTGSFTSHLILLIWMNLAIRNITFLFSYSYAFMLNNVQTELVVLLRLKLTHTHALQKHAGLGVFLNAGFPAGSFFSSSYLSCINIVVIVAVFLLLSGFTHEWFEPSWEKVDGCGREITFFLSGVSWSNLQPIGFLEIVQS